MEPFRFKECVYIIEPTGQRAATLREFSSLLRDVPPASIFFHMHQSYLHMSLEAPEFMNDFSNWAAVSLEDRALAEKLANVAPFEFGSIDPDLRRRLSEIVDTHIAQHPEKADLPAKPFFFNSATTLIVDGPMVDDLLGLRSELASVHVSSIYFHVFFARLHHHQATDDFSAWVEQNYEAPAMVRAIRSIDPYMHTLESLRGILVRVIDRFASEVRRRA